MCGIVAFLPKKGKIPNRRFLLSMALGNEERGVDNCGLSSGDTILKCKKTTHKFRDFYNDNRETIDGLLSQSKPIIIHTRRSTSYSKESEFAHPFYFYKEGDTKNYIIGCHNGIITNKDELYTSFCNNTEKSLLTIDSQYLMVSLLLHDINKVLKAYVGDAASVFYNEDRFHVWKGGLNNIEERPMHYLETKDGYYFCSTYENMLFNSDYDEVPKSLANNELMIFDVKSGTLIESKIIERKREALPAKTYNFSKELGLSVDRDSFGRLVNSVTKRVVNGVFYTYTYHDRIYYIYTSRTAESQRKITIANGVVFDATPSEAKRLFLEIKHKKFNIKSFLNKNRQLLSKILVGDFPIVYNNNLMFMITNINGVVSCMDGRKYLDSKNKITHYGHKRDYVDYYNPVTGEYEY